MSKFKDFDKQIYFVKIIMWEACPLRCSYCFVDKEDGRVISEDNLLRFIDLLLYSPGHNKLLHLLWGEPLLCFDLIKKAVIYARKLEKKLWKQLDISFCTSGILFDQEKLDFINKSDIYLAWSIDGPEHIHNKNRILANWKWSFQKIIQKKEIVRSTIKDTHLGIAMTIDKNVIHELFDSYKYLVEEEWFDCTINLAPVDWVVWMKKEKKKFITDIEKIHQYIFDNIAKWNFYYLNSMNKEFRFNMLSVFRKQGGRCLWFYTEWFTNGDVVFNAFINKEEDYSHFVVANIWDDDFMEKVDKYIGCRFDHKSELCQNCRSDYFHDMNSQLKDVQMNYLLAYRDRISVFFANKIRIAAKTNPIYKEYIELAKDYMYV